LDDAKPHENLVLFLADLPSGRLADYVLEVDEVMDRIRELTGVYGLGFRKQSVAGLIAPIAFVLIVGILGAVLVRFVL
jgi:hypothetical protein